MNRAICAIMFCSMVSSCGGSCDLSEISGSYVYESTTGLAYELNLDMGGAGDLIIDGVNVESFSWSSDASTSQIFIKASPEIVDQLWEETGFSAEPRSQEYSAMAYLGFRPHCSILSAAPKAMSIGPDASVTFLRQTN